MQISVKLIKSSTSVSELLNSRNVVSKPERTTSIGTLVKNDLTSIDKIEQTNYLLDQLWSIYWKKLYECFSVRVLVIHKGKKMEAIMPSCYTFFDSCTLYFWIIIVIKIQVN